MLKICFNKKHQKAYIKRGLEEIIPLDVVLRIKEVLDNENISIDYIKSIVYNKNYFSRKKSHKEIGSYYGAYRFLTKNKKAFNNFILGISQDYSAIFLWHRKKHYRIYLSLFEAYCFISEYRNAYFNSMHFCCDGTSNPELFNKPIRYYQCY